MVRVIPFTRPGWARPVRSEESNGREQRSSAKRAGLETRPRRAGGNSSRCAGDTGSDTGRRPGDTGGDAGRPGCNAGCSGVGLGGGCCSRLRGPCCRHPFGYCNSPVEQPQPLRTEAKRAGAPKDPGLLRLPKNPHNYESVGPCGRRRPPGGKLSRHASIRSGRGPTHLVRRGEAGTVTPVRENRALEEDPAGWCGG